MKMTNIAISTKQATIQPQGYVNAANAEEFLHQLTKAVRSQENTSVLLVDMERVEFLDSAGLMALVKAFRLAQSLDRSFRICSPPPSVRMVFELTQLDRVFDIVDYRNNLEAA